MKTQYFEITGLDQGIPIEPFVICSKTNDLDFYLNVTGDRVRYYEEISREQYIKTVVEKLEKSE